jgi:hypothetical protein
MPDFTGKDLNLQWIYSGGTVVLSTDYRTLSESKEMALVDASAGADTDRTYLTTLKDGTLEYAALHQTGGSVIKLALEPGTSGTLIVGPEGTAAGKPKESIPAIVSNRAVQYPYADVVEISATFQRNGSSAGTVF